jgi:lipoprotein-anchoring transpeptidase ErfK/SrfK
MIHIPSLLFAAALSVLTSDSSQATGNAGAVPAGRLSLYANLTQHTLYVRIGDSVAAAFPIAIGTDDHPTPTGTFRIREIVWNPGWVPPRSPWARDKTAKRPGHPDNPMKLVKIFFQEPDYYIHGTSDLESIGGRASHGCLRMLPDEAATVAWWVMEHGGNPKPESWFRRVLRFTSREQVVYLQNPISLTIEQ